MCNAPEQVTIADVRRAFEEADLAGTEVGEFRKDVVIPVHNELRNAGYHLVRALNDDGSVRASHHLYDARDHCRRATYDAAIAGIVSAREWLAQFQERYRDVPVAEVVPTFPDIMRLDHDARDLVANGRYDQKSDGERVHEYMNTFRSLRDGIDVLEDHRHDLEARRRTVERGDRFDELRTRGIVVSAAVGVATLAGAIAGFILNRFFGQ